MKEFYVKKDGDKIILTIREIKETKVELDLEDIQQLSDDLKNYLELPKFKGIDTDKIQKAWVYPSRMDNVNSSPSGIQFHNKEHKEAYEQAQSKLKLEKDWMFTVEELQEEIKKNKSKRNAK